MKTFALKKIHQMHEKFEFDQVIECVGPKEEDEEIKSNHLVKKKMPKKITLVLLINFIKMFKK